DSIDSLKVVIESGAAVKLKGFGEKTVATILAGMSFVEKSATRTPLGIALPIAEAIVDRVRAIPGAERVEGAGSLRRGAETVGAVDILCEAVDGPAVVSAFTSFPVANRVLASGDTKGSILVDKPGRDELQVDLRVVPGKSFGAALQYFTGSKEHNVRVREL